MPSSSDTPRPARRPMPVLAAFVDGWRRALAAPVLVLGVWAMTNTLLLPLAGVAGDQAGAQAGPLGIAEDVASGWDRSWGGEFGAALAAASRLWDGTGPPAALLWTTAGYGLLWLWLTGGILFRLARGRPARASVFFAACGVFLFRFLRLGLLVGPCYAVLFLWWRPLLFETILGWWVRDQTNDISIAIGRVAVTLAFVAPLLLVGVVADFAKIRLVVEDRRSAIAAVAAGGRFARRRAGRVAGLYALNLGAALAEAAIWSALAPGAGASGWAALLAGQVYLVARLWARLAFMASELAFFQGELAHAGYTALPDPTWRPLPTVESLRRTGG